MSDAHWCKIFDLFFQTNQEVLVVPFVTLVIPQGTIRIRISTVSEKDGGVARMCARNNNELYR